MTSKDTTATEDNTHVSNSPIQPGMSISINVNNNTKNYATVVKKVKTHFTPIIPPRKEDAIIFPVVDDIANENYALAMIDTIKPENIRFVSRLFNGRVCIYLDSKSTVDHFMQEKGYIQIKYIKIAARRLINPAKKIILSNVSPIIPDDLLAKELIKATGPKLCSPVTYISGS